MNPDYCIRVDPEDIRYGDPVGGTTGVKNGDMIRGRLDYYILQQKPVQVLVYDQTMGNKKTGQEAGCGKAETQSGLRYKVKGFACFVMTGYRLSQGQGMVQCDLTTPSGTLACKECTRTTDPVTKLVTVNCGPISSGESLRCDPALNIDIPGTGCVDSLGQPCEYETGDVNRISGWFVSCVNGGDGDCHAVGNMMAPNLCE
jgi:hypothetical protein